MPRGRDANRLPETDDETTGLSAAVNVNRAASSPGNRNTVFGALSAE
jgi:hypothetical protein